MMSTLGLFWRTTIFGVLIFACASAQAGTFLGGLASRWNAAPSPPEFLERSLEGGLRYSVSGGSYQAFRDLFHWTSVPSVASFQKAVEDAFNAWTIVDPATGLTTDLRFVADLSTPVAGTAGFSGVNSLGAEIDVLAKNAGDSSARAHDY